jgi:peptidylprolyl isomerase
MSKTLFALPFLAFTLIAAKDPLPPPPKPPVSLTAPAEVAADPANKWTLELSNGGKVVIQLRPDVAPQHVYRIQELTAHGFYNGLAFHRVIAGFMAQGGDPKGTGEGGSTLPDLPAEFNDLPHMRGVVSMARTEEPNSANSQFFIMLAPTFKLDHKYSAFGRVIEGMAAVDGIAVGEPPSQPTKIVRATIGGPLPAPPVIAATPAPETVPAARPPAEQVAAPAPETMPVAAPPAEQAAVPTPTADTAAPAPAEQEAPAPAEPATETPAQAPAEPQQEAPPPQPQ